MATVNIRTHSNHLIKMTPSSIRLEQDFLLIKTPQGSVRIQKKYKQIEASYQGDRLVNGSAHAYALQILEAAIEYTRTFPFPWEIASDGTQHITDHKRFYEQTFKTELLGIETLRRWTETSHKDSSE